MNRKSRVALVLVTLATLVAGTALAHASRESGAAAKKKAVRGASSKLVYEEASDEEVAAYFAEGQPKITCVAANTKSGCK